MASNIISARTTDPFSVREDLRLENAAPFANLLGALGEAFGNEFSMVDAISGEVVHCATDHSGLDWSVRGEMCRAVGRRCKPEVIEDDDPLLSLAIPLPVSDEQAIVAVGTFVSRQVGQQESLTNLEQMLGLDATSVTDWMRRQSAWSADALLAMARLFLEKQTADRRAAGLAKEVDNLSLHLATTYEEISLLYRLTQNLKLSSKDDELGQLALEWLADVVPAESLAIQLVPPPKANTVTHDLRKETMLLTYGPCPVSCAQFTALVERLDVKAGYRPHIINQKANGNGTPLCPGVRQMVAVPLSEGSNIFGWLVAFNHIQGREFGTVEASLLTSVAAILGIHSGNTELYRQQADFFAGVVRALTSAIDAKDPYTCGHSNRVAQVAVRLARELGSNPEQLNTIYLSGLLHDIGKIGIDDTVLRKPGRLTDVEYEHIKTHTEIGFRILDGIQQLDEVLPVVLHHHEQWDGKGYPHALAGENIPWLARIVAVADAFDAMGSDRPYRKGMPEEKLDSILQEGAGKQWDARVVEAFFRARDDIREISGRERRNLNLDVRQWL